MEFDDGDIDPLGARCLHHLVNVPVEQDADMVLLLHREDAYERESPRAGEADFILAKHRNGPTGYVPLVFIKEFMRFELGTRDDQDRDD